MEQETVGDREYLVFPGRYPVGIVLVHEIRGLDEYARSVAGQLAGAGYSVVAVDLFRGQRAATLQEGFDIKGACDLDFGFCIDYYGMIPEVDDLRGLKGPVLLFIGSEDPRVTPWAYTSFLPAATRYKKRVDLHLYPGAGHAFHRPSWEGHNPAAAKDAWAKTMIFLSSRRVEFTG